MTRDQDRHRPDIRETYPDGMISVHETMTIVFYSRTPHLDMLDQVAQSIRDFASLVSFSALNTYYDYEGQEEGLDAQTLEDILHQRFYSSERSQNANIVLAGGSPHARQFYVWYSGTAIDNPEVPDEASCLWCWLPRAHFLENEAKVMQFASGVAARLPFTYGYVSPALAGEQKLRRQALAARHPGLDVAHPVVVSTDIADKAAGAYWINFLGPGLTARLGGEGELRATLPRDIAVDALGGGKCRVTLGPEPEIGDTNRMQNLPSYRAFARRLDSAGVLHVPERVVYFVDADNAADRDAMERWHRRFLA